MQRSRLLVTVRAEHGLRQATGSLIMTLGRNMNLPLTGTWVSARSDIPEYQPGCEWLHFTQKGDHVWEIGQSEGKGRPSLNRVTLKEDVSRYTLILLNQHGETVIAQIDCHGPEEIRVTPTHGHVTFFKRAERPPLDRII